MGIKTDSTTTIGIAKDFANRDTTDIHIYGRVKVLLFSFKDANINVQNTFL